MNTITDTKTQEHPAQQQKPEIRCPVCQYPIPDDWLFPKTHCRRCGWIAT